MTRIETVYWFSHREGQDDKLFEPFWEYYDWVGTTFKEITLLFSLLFCGSNKLMFLKIPICLFLEIKIAKTYLLYVTSW